MGRDDVDLSSFMAKVIIAVVLGFVLVWILANVAVVLGIILILGAIVGIGWGLTVQDEDTMVYSLVAGFAGLVLLVGGMTTLSFFDNNPVGQNYSCAVNSVFTWIDHTFSEKIGTNLISNWFHIGESM